MWGGVGLVGLLSVEVLLSAKAAVFGGGAATAVVAAAVQGKAAAAVAAPALAPFVDIALALVGVWIVMSSVALDTAAAGPYLRLIHHISA